MANDWSLIQKLIQKSVPPTGASYEFCPRCEANLTLQKGYRNDLPYWNCRGCGEMLINPDVPDDGNVAWICDGCEAMLNVQEGFTPDCGVWTCTACGAENRIDESQIYLTDEEYRADLFNPYRGLTDAQLLELSAYVEVEILGEREHVILVEDPECGKRYVKKYLHRYDLAVFRHLMAHPVPNMPKILGLYEGESYLTVIEEYIEGRTVAEMMEDGPMDPAKAVHIVRSIAHTLKALHAEKIIHRDIKPSNVIEREDGLIFVLDMDAAKQSRPERTDVTRFVGTPHYAAPEQFGYGLKSSGAKADVYALGVMLNVMVTGKYPKEKKASETIWEVVEACIPLEPDKRCSIEELICMLDRILE